MNAYEIRHVLFAQASETLHTHWERSWEQEVMTAERESRAPKKIDPPSLDEITTYADRVLNFVEKKIA